MVGEASSLHGGSCLDKEGVCAVEVFEVGCGSFHVITSRLDSKKRIDTMS